MNRIDQTIDAICGWIEKELESKETLVTGSNILPEMIKALAELVSARTKNTSIICISHDDTEANHHAEFSQESSFEAVKKAFEEAIHQN